MPHSSPLALAFPELYQLEQLINQHPQHIRAQSLATIQVNHHALPIWAIEIGSQAANVPTIGLFGGVHGMERIGSQILLAWLENLLARCQWDNSLLHLLSTVRLVCIPLLNVGGLLNSTRSNPNVWI